MVNINGGLDPRDCHLDIAFMLGDASIPDDVDWPENQRDKSCVWLDFEDLQFDVCVHDDAPKQESFNLSVSEISNDIIAEKIEIPDFEAENSFREISPPKLDSSHEYASNIPIIIAVPKPLSQTDDISPKKNEICNISAPNKTINTSNHGRVATTASKTNNSVNTTVKRIRGCTIETTRGCK
jgi:hypothetical protein